MKMRAARMRLNTTPAEITTIRCHTGFERNSHGCGSLAANSASMLSSTIPEILTYPPSGIAPSRYSVSPMVFPNTRGGNPIENCSTRIRKSLAARKWPSSWTKISSPSAIATQKM
jgi:hypothetical protein